MTRRPTFSSGRKLALPLASVVVSGAAILNLSSDTSQAVPQLLTAPTCTLNVPAKFAISSPYYEVPITRGADCAAAGVIDAQWDAKRSDGALMYQLMFRWDYPESWNVFDNDSLATWTWHPAGATTGDITLASSDKPATTPAPRGTAGSSVSQAAAEVPQNTPTTDVRLGSFTDLVVYEPDANGNMAFWVHGFRYSITPADLIPWGAAPGSIQYRPIGGTTWSVLKSFTTDASGQATHSIKWPGKREYRAVIYDSQLIYGSISPIETR